MKWQQISPSLSKILTASRQHPNTSWNAQCHAKWAGRVEERKKRKEKRWNSSFCSFPMWPQKGKIIQHGQLSRDFSLIAGWMKGLKAIKQVLRGNKEERMWSEQAYQGGVRTQRQAAGCLEKDFTSDEVHQSLDGSKHQRLIDIFSEKKTPSCCMKCNIWGADARLF